MLSLRGEKGSARKPTVVTEDTDGEGRARQADGADGLDQKGLALGTGSEDFEEERRWQSALSSAAARE